jgi:transcriptional regulator GlxA family with amidase domain
MPRKTCDREGRIRMMADWLRTSWDSGTRWDERLQASLCGSIVAEYLRLTSVREDPLSTQIRSFMRSRLAEPLTLDILAKHAGMSKYHFARRYKTATGHPPMQDLRTMRLHRARQLLLTTDLSRVQIAAETGFCDEYHLSHSFRQKLGVCPRDIRGRRK